ncbi:ATP-binding protein [Arthrobacter woluwensis]|uniref:ATP-binding protein n=1 Tax=Arthrobacter woluwensis TaxID=156980 RepID=UPI0037F439DB
MNKNPVLDFDGHLMITTSGSIWATWTLKGLQYDNKSLEEKQAVREAHKALVRSMRGEALLLGLGTPIDPAQVALAMAEGEDLDAKPELRAEIEARYEQMLLNGPDGDRVFYLSVPLRFDPLTKARLWVESALASGASALALPRWTAGRQIRRGRFGDWVFMGSELMTRARDAADLVYEAIPGVFEPRPVSWAEQAWIFEEAQLRGLTVPNRPDPDDYASSEGNSGKAIAGVEIHEGAALAKDTMEKLMPWRTRYLKVQSEDMEQPSYQVPQVFAGVPSGGAVFPGVEMVKLISDISDRSDWAMRIHVFSKEAAKRKNKAAERNLEDQEQQRSDGEKITGKAGELGAVAENLVGYTQELNSSESEVEVDFTTIVTSYGATKEEALEEAALVRKGFKGMEFRLTPVLGHLTDLWWQTLPGTPTSSTTREYAQLQTSIGWSASIPFASTHLGHESGTYLADVLSQTGSRVRPLLHNLAQPMMTDSDGSFGICGELGSGKSVAGKTIAAAVADAHGRVFAIDRSNNGEWEHFARSVEGHVVVRILNPEYSLDPLRLFGPERAARSANGFFGTLLDIEPMSDLGTALSAALDPEYLLKHSIRSSGALLKHLLSDECHIEGRERLTARMKVLSTTDYGAVIFDENLPPMPTSSDIRMTVFRTIGLDLPTAGELSNETRYKRMRLEKKFGASMYQLIMEISRELCLENNQQLACFIVDETHHLTGFPSGAEALEDFIRVARKDLAFLVLLSHDPSKDFVSKTLVGLIKTRILMRHTDKSLARKGLEFLELEVTDEMLDMVTKDLSPKNWREPGTGQMKVHPGRRGEALFRDELQETAKVAIMPPARPERALAVLTTPGEERAAA